MNPVSLETLNAADRKAFAAMLGDVMELAPWVADQAYAARPFASIAALYQAMTDAARKAGDAPLRQSRARG
jgi:2-oxo-4-hydroxy-4-carboxy--5-ureidoimidazoline (OHCU) decarboxylase